MLAGRLRFERLLPAPLDFAPTGAVRPRAVVQ